MSQMRGSLTSVWLGSLNTSNMVTSNDKATNTNTPDQINAESTTIKEELITEYTLGKSTEHNENEFTHKFSVTSLSGIEGIPFQFLGSVDRKVNPSGNTSAGDNNVRSYLGRKYTEKILTQIPLLFLAPCEPAFMDDITWNNNDKSILKQALAGAIDNVDELLNGEGKFYSAVYAYHQYYSYLNAMLTSLVTFLGIGENYVSINGSSSVKLKDINWENETNEDFTNAYLAKKNLIFYMDAINSISESFGNNTSQSMVASIVNGISDSAKEIDYLFGTSGSNAISAAKSSIGDLSKYIGDSLGKALGGNDSSLNIAGGIIGSIGQSTNSLLEGGKIVFPEMWADSEYSKSYNIDIKLRTPYYDKVSIFMNILKPYCKILALTLPHMVGVNSYRTPFLTKAYCKGLFNIDLGIISGLNVTKGATCCWTDDGLPTQIDISIDIKDLYSQLTMTGYESDDEANKSLLSSALTIANLGNKAKQIANIVNNTTYMDFLANMAGLNINEMVWTRKIRMYYDLFTNNFGNLWEETVSSRLSTKLQNVVGRIYSY